MFKAAFAEEERKKATERTGGAFAVKRERGEKCGGKVPFSYRLAGENAAGEEDVGAGAGRTRGYPDYEPVEGRGPDLPADRRGTGTARRFDASCKDGMESKDGVGVAKTGSVGKGRSETR